MTLARLLCLTILLFGAAPRPDGLEPGDERALVVRGIVTDAKTGEPIHGALVQIGPYHGRLEGTSIAETRSAADGSFHHQRRADLGRHRLWVTVSRPGYGFWHSQQTFRGTGIWFHRVALDPAEKVSGRVLLPTGKPAPGGWVALERLGETGRPMGHGIPDKGPYPEVPREGTVPFHRACRIVALDEKGRFTVWTRAHQIRIFAESPGFPVHIQTLDFPAIVESKDPLVIRLESRSRFDAFAVDPGGKPIPGVRVTQAVHTGRVSGATYSSTVTKSTGPEKPFRLFERKLILMRLSHPGYVSRSLRTSPPPPETALRIPLEVATWVNVRLEDEHGAVAARPRFGLRHDVWSERKKAKVESTTTMVWDAKNGVFRSGPMDPELTYGLGDLHVPGYLPRRIHWKKAAGAHDLETVRLLRGRTLEVQVLGRDGQPLRDVRVILRQGVQADRVQPELSPYTGELGRVAFSGIGDGSVRVEVDEAGYRPYSRHVKLKKQRTVHRVQLRAAGDRGR